MGDVAATAAAEESTTSETLARNASLEVAGESDPCESAGSVRNADEVVFEDPTTETFNFWFEGALITGVSVVGLIFNFVAVAVLVRPRMRGSFHTLLVSHKFYDILN